MSPNRGETVGVQCTCFRKSGKFRSQMKKFWGVFQEISIFFGDISEINVEFQEILLYLLRNANNFLIFVDFVEFQCREFPFYLLRNLEKIWKLRV